MLLWWLAGVLLLKAAVPLIAASAAHQRGVTLAEVCSVYGVRTVSAEQYQSTPQPQAEHAGDDHCGLAPALGAVMLGDVPKSAVALHAPAAARAAPSPIFKLPPDRHLAWLLGRTHAPPTQA